VLLVPDELQAASATMAAAPAAVAAITRAFTASLQNL